MKLKVSKEQGLAAAAQVGPSPVDLCPVFEEQHRLASAYCISSYASALPCPTLESGKES